MAFATDSPTRTQFVAPTQRALSGPTLLCTALNRARNSREPERSNSVRARGASRKRRLHNGGQSGRAAQSAQMQRD